MYLKKLIEDTFNFRAYAGEDGAPSGDVAVEDAPEDQENPEATDEAGNVDPNKIDIEKLIPEDVTDEGERAYRRQVLETTDENELNELWQDYLNGTETGNNDPKEEPANIADAEPSEEASEETESEEVQYEDDILPGLTGDDFAKLPDSVKSVIADARVEMDKTKEDSKRIEEILENDPVAKHRLKKNEDGTAKDLYTVPSMDNKQLENVQKLLDNDDFAGAKKAIDGFVKTAAEAVISNERIQLEENQKFNSDLEQAGKVLLQATKLNPKMLDLGIEDPLEIANIKAGHEKHGAYKDGIGKVVDDIISMNKRGVVGDVRKYINELGAEGVYMMGAKKYGWPVVQNADDVINKQIKQAVSDTVALFQRKKGDTAGPVAAGLKKQPKDSAEARFSEGGVDLKKLASDEEYYSQILYSKGFEDSTWVDKVADMRIRGEKLLAKDNK